MYIINYYQAGANQQGSTFSTSLGCQSFEKDIDFDIIRKLGADLIQSTLEGNPPCFNELKVFYNILLIEDDTIVGSYVGNIKSSKILKWRK